MAKKQANPVDLRAALLKRVRLMLAELVMLETERKGCINEKAHLAQYYNGRIEQGENELDYLNRLLDA